MSKYNKHSLLMNRIADVIELLTPSKCLMQSSRASQNISPTTHFNQTKPPRHPKWKEANISLTIPGWQRFKAADDWLARNRQSPDAQRGRFEQFLVETGLATGDDPTKREALFRQFMDWQKRRR